jgi:hypothetical protein
LEYKEPMYDFATLKATTLNNKLWMFRDTPAWGFGGGGGCGGVYATKILQLTIW